MKKLGFLLPLCCLLAAACTQTPDCKEFVRTMYEESLYEDYGFLEKHCSEALLKKLSDEYDYEDGGYAVWLFRSGCQDGDSDEHRIVSITEDGDWYTYEGIDMGCPFTRKVRLSTSGGRIIIEDLE